MAVGLILTNGWVDVEINPDGDDGLGRGSVRPGEFLYLDENRVAAYLAQLEGGTSSNQRLTQKLTTETKAAAGAGESFSVGASAQEERFVERQVTPTAASSLFQLRNQLDFGGDDGLQHPTTELLGDLAALDLSEGDFIELEDVELVSPRYINPYIVVRQAGTLDALFPDAPRLQQKAKQFAREVGPNPRMVFVLREERADGATSKKGEPLYVKYLLPLQYQQLTDERALLEEGGGHFTVLGKIVRSFTDESPGAPRYIDSATRQVWGQPIKSAPMPLLEKTGLSCTGPEIKNTRACLITQLDRQTGLKAPAAVVIPVAIYK